MPHYFVSLFQARIVAAGQLPRLEEANSLAGPRASEPVSSETSSRVQAAVAELIRGPAAAASTQAVRQRSIRGVSSSNSSSSSLRGVSSNSDSTRGVSSSSSSSATVAALAAEDTTPGAIGRLHEALPPSGHRFPSANSHGAEDVSCRVSGTLKHGGAEAAFSASEAVPGSERNFRSEGTSTSVDVHVHRPQYNLPQYNLPQYSLPQYNLPQYKLREPPDDMLDDSDPFEDRRALLLTNASPRPGGGRRAAAAAGVHTVRPPPQRGGRVLRRRLRRREAEERAPW